MAQQLPSLDSSHRCCWYAVTSGSKTGQASCEDRAACSAARPIIERGGRHLTFSTTLRNWTVLQQSCTHRAGRRCLRTTASGRRRAQQGGADIRIARQGAHAPENRSRALAAAQVQSTHSAIRADAIKLFQFFVPPRTRGPSLTPHTSCRPQAHQLH